MKTIRLKAPAKVNLILEVLRKLPSGFHELRTVMAKIPSLYDEISITFCLGKEGIFLKSDNKIIPLDEKNICFKSAKKFLEKTGKSVGIKIDIKKNIPIGAGLGGGSSDGAATLKILNKYFHHPISEKQLIKLGAEVGKDIPFFFSLKNAAFIEGAGEKISKVFDLLKMDILLVNPKIHISTKQAYEKLSPEIKKIARKDNASSKMMLAIKNKKLDLISKYLYNDFEIVIEKEYPVIKEIKDKLKNLGASGALMTGSGSTVFGIFKDRRKALMAKKEMKKCYPKFFVEIG
jgi:4-diphosphocytidyl-2-C-methyl-D-erythritol kinase